MNDLPKLITIKQASKLLGVTPLTLRNWDKNGKLCALRHPMNNYRVYKREDIEKLIENMQVRRAESPRPQPKPAAKKGPKKLQVRHLDEYGDDARA